MPFATLALYLSFGLFCAMALAWGLARRPGQSGLMDVMWSLSTAIAGACGALVAAPGAVPARQFAVAALALAWGVRLAWHIWQRGHHGNHDDPRYAELRKEWGNNADARLFLFAEIQALAALILALAIAAAARNPAPFPQWSDIAGLAMVVIAVAGEGIADAQLVRWRKVPENKGEVCETGLWSVSRHPNYFFEWLGWCAWPVIAIGPDAADGWAWLTLAAPAMMYALLVHVSGIPPLEAHMLRSRGAKFADSQRRISAFWPVPRRTG
ncbi:DUF1295 domain-containing protein [Novosphingobium sp.]|uniref:DUF1295 domain-containing protein n=1 Tax=Novosphingobium sp. TaxID=1874826 RepID=UPI003B5264BA